MTNINKKLFIKNIIKLRIPTLRNKKYIYNFTIKEFFEKK